MSPSRRRTDELLECGLMRTINHRKERLTEWDYSDEWDGRDGYYGWDTGTWDGLNGKNERDTDGWNAGQRDGYQQDGWDKDKRDGWNVWDTGQQDGWDMDRQDGWNGWDRRDTDRQDGYGWGGQRRYR